MLPFVVTSALSSQLNVAVSGTRKQQGVRACMLVWLLKPMKCEALRDVFPGGQWGYLGRERAWEGLGW